MHGIGIRLKVWRETQKLSQEDAAACLKLSGSTYQNYEREVRAPNTDAWWAFCCAGINTNWLLTGEGPMLIADLVAPAPPGINADAMVQAIAAIFQVAPKGESVESLARKAVAFYQYCESQGLITPEGQGTGVLNKTA